MFFKKIEGLKELGVVPRDIVEETLDLIQEYEWSYNKIRAKIYKQHKDTETILLRFKPPDVLEIESKGNLGDYNYELYNYGLMSRYGGNMEKCRGRRVMSYGHFITKGYWSQCYIFCFL